ncbi:MAG: 4Fe-4S dicluster domain-containing protein [Candidatus Stahlbacteria bacterium]|nr:4Fe-4S dicluster domain-containing protein [Candidatus Stahlbacteria bacterium]
MDIFKIEKSNIKRFLEELSQKYSVFAPVEADGIISFMEIGNEIPKQVRNDNLKLDFYNTDKSPKELFFPQSETIIPESLVLTCPDDAPVLTQNRSGEWVKITENRAPQTANRKPIIVFGTRPCDAKSFTLLNKVFVGGKYVDIYWQEKYDKAIIFSFACNNPRSTCFCHWVGGGPFNKEGADVFLVDIGDAFIIEPCSEKGVAVIKATQKATKEDLNKVVEIKNKAEVKPVELKEVFVDTALWEELAYKCLGCGVCTYFCPTCHCFDIQDEGKGNKCKRIRIWDSCMFKQFTQEAAGTNPRPTLKERISNRILHKFKYLPENIGEVGCCGCGRCIINCPVNIDIRKIIQIEK